MAKMMMQTAYTDVEMEVNAGVARELLRLAEDHPQTRVLSRADGDGVDVAELRGLVTALRGENDHLRNQHYAVLAERDKAQRIISALHEAIVTDQDAKVHPGSILREVTKSLRSYVNDGSLVGYAAGLSDSRISTRRRRQRRDEEARGTRRTSSDSLIESFERMDWNAFVTARHQTSADTHGGYWHIPLSSRTTEAHS